MQLLNLVRMTSLTTGTGTLTLAAAVAGFISMNDAGAVDGKEYSYAIEADFSGGVAQSREVGTGIYTASGTTLTRRVINSTNGNNALNLAGDAHVIITPNEDDIYIPQGCIFGLVISNNSTTAFDVAAGACASKDNPAYLMTLAAALTGKVVGTAWSVGNSGGALDTGAVSNTTYHVYLIRRPDTGVVDACVSTSASAPTFGGNIPSAYTQYRRIGSLVRSGGSIKAFLQSPNNNDMFTWMAPVTDINVTNPGTSAVSRTISVPINIVVEAYGWGSIYNGSNNLALLISDLNTTDTAPTTSGPYNAYAQSSPAARVTYAWRCNTNTPGQIRSRFSASGTLDELVIVTAGWFDARGRFGGN